MNKLYPILAAGVLGTALFAADPAPAAKAEAKPAPAAKVDVWKNIPDVVATVDGKNVTKAELIAFAGEVPPQVTPELVSQLAPGMVREMLAERLRKADMEARNFKITKEDAHKFIRENGFDKLPEQQQQQIVKMLAEKGKTVDQYIDTLLANPQSLTQVSNEVFIRREIIKNADEVTDEEAKKFYDAHVNEFPEVVSASHILAMVKPDADEAAKKAALDKINRIAAELKQNPAAFETIAAKESDCPSKAKGGKLGEFPRRQMDPEFEKAAFALKTGEISGVVQSSFGYHIIRCDAAAHRVPFENLRRDLKMMLGNQKAQTIVNGYLNDLFKKHQVDILVKAPAMPAPDAAK